MLQLKIKIAHMDFNLFKPKGKLGVDIGTASIKIAELEKKTTRFVLSNYGLFELKEMKSAGKEGTTPFLGQSILKLPDDEIVWGIKEVIKRANMKSRDVIASIPSFSTFSTIIEMPYISEQDLSKVMPFEAKKHIPIPLDEVVLDWSIVGTSNQGEKKTPLVNVEIFLAAVPKSETQRYKNIITSAGLNLIALELENSALIRALLGNDLSPTALVNIGGRSTSIVIVDKGYERVAHNYEIGGFEITKSIARSLNIGLERAEELKKKLGLKETEENIINEAMVSLMDMMVFETKKTITNYETAKNTKISRILLVGGLTNMPNFLNYFKSKLGREVFIGNALSRLIYSENLNPIIKDVASTFAISVGLAMRDK